MADIHSTKTGRRVKDRVGIRYSKLLVIARAHQEGSNIYWKCQCDCGKTHLARGSNLHSGSITSCGCIRDAALVAMNTTHGMRHTVEYKAWRSMKLRCRVPTDRHWPNYGGRGIAVCDALADDFAWFFACLGKRPEGTSLDRIDNDRGYECGKCDACLKKGVTPNVRWADKFQQAQNRRGIHNVTFRGETKCLTEWCRLLGLNRVTIGQRLQRGWTVEDALTLNESQARRGLGRL